MAHKMAHKMATTLKGEVINDYPPLYAIDVDPYSLLISFSVKTFCKHYAYVASYCMILCHYLKKLLKTKIIFIYIYKYNT